MKQSEIGEFSWAKLLLVQTNRRALSPKGAVIGNVPWAVDKEPTKTSKCVLAWGCI